MLNTLKRTGKKLNHEIIRAWENLSEGWHELLSCSNNALTYFTRHKDSEQSSSVALTSFPRWSLLAGELEETHEKVVVWVELPGLGKEDFQTTMDGNVLYLSGGKHSERETNDSRYHIMERAYGAFQRTIPSSCNVVIEQAKVHLINRVLTVRLPKVESHQARSIPVH